MRYDYNLSGSNRKPLVDAVSQILNQPAAYQGAPSFAYTIGDYMIDRNGVLSCEDSIDPETISALTEALQERSFVAETINDTADAETAEENTNDADEAETAVDNATEADNSDFIVEILPKADATEENTTMAVGDTAVTENITYVEVAGSESSDILTIEIPDTDFTPEAKENLRKIVVSKKTVLEKALGADGLPIVEKDGKIAFPWFTLHGLDGEADAYSRLVAAICRMAKEQKRVTATEKPVENEKFTMRLFLIRLGFIGDEFKTARKILLRNLTGNASWKSGQKPERSAETAVLPNPAEAAMPTDQELATPLEEDIMETEPQKDGGELHAK